jgi:putative membrane protein
MTTATNELRIPYFQNKLLIGLTVLFVISWFFFYAKNVDHTDWWIENILVFLFCIYLMATYRNFKFSDTSYTFLYLFMMLHIFGAMYAYTHNPVGDWIQKTWNLWRNPYDRIVHFSFGFLLAYPLRDKLINQLGVKGKWQYILPVELILSLACIFELIEWGVYAVTPKETGENYVATQGDPWDAHKDIAVAVVGATVTMLGVYLYNKKKSNKFDIK